MSTNDLSAKHLFRGRTANLLSSGHKKYFPLITTIKNPGLQTFYDIPHFLQELEMPGANRDWRYRRLENAVWRLGRFQYALYCRSFGLENRSSRYIIR